MKRLHEVFRFDRKVARDQTQDTPVAGADYVVKKDDWGEVYFDHYQRLNWGDLTGKEKIKELGKSAGKLVAATAFLGITQLLVGETGSDLPDAEFDTRAKSEVTAQYMGVTALDKFEMTYLKTQDTQVSLYDGGSGILGAITGSSAHSYTYGQQCLAGTAYNTNPSEIRGFSGGDITAAASLAASAYGGVEVYPAGSITPPLVFEYSDTGVLLPDNRTARTLADHGCNTSGLPIWASMDGDRFSTVIK
jgi:hypothetical protein